MVKAGGERKKREKESVGDIYKIRNTKVENIKTHVQGKEIYQQRNTDELFDEAEGAGRPHDAPHGS